MRSKLEEWIYSCLKKLNRRRKYKVKIGYESEKLVYHSDYVPDFVLTLKSGKKIYIETKGYLRPTDRTKMRKVKRDNPDKDIRIIFSRDQALRQGSKMLYSEWAEKNGFPWAINEVPKDWLK